MSGKNLFTIRLDNIVAPKRVLRDQAAYLAQLSDGTIYGKVETTRGNKGQSEYFIHAFRISVPKIDYSAKLFEVTHPIDVYPVQITSDDWSLERECADAAAFEATVSEILNAPVVKRRLESLRSQAFAEMDSPAPNSSAVAMPDPTETPAPDEYVPEPAAAAAPAPAEAPVEAPVVAEVAAAAPAPAEPAAPVFYDWASPIEFNVQNVDLTPEGRGAAILYTPSEDPVFIIYSNNLRAALQRQLTGRGSGEVSRRIRTGGLVFVCGAVDSIDRADDEVKSRIGRQMFNGLLGDGLADWY